ncbi:sigma-54 interaction domain-containing protein [Paraburkholderia humisilvae]|uniref:Transcriptional regulatory protein QseF n=1 Tax=Paraburkholderia humisilvae TaxID=627669 RepID=A0A6J5F6F7_9BURK|nr:sigma-54 dependent transcriptional regulator [Paraburkholderia humisilvae]CAB3773953.1 Transcriptional regulatory protein QseF [Paraburkholderia humisilvae]
MDQFARLNFHGSSPVMSAMRRQIEKIASVDVPVTVLGETGTGKELAVRAIHYLSARKQYPFVPVNCGALPESLIESELFGHERGAFTDAKAEGRGLIAEAEKGTLFLDEVDALGLKAQASLLRFIQDGTYRRVGGSSTRHADVRVVVATNANLVELAEARLFRRDLLYRLDVVSLHIPALRERGDDVTELAMIFLDRLRVRYTNPAKHFHHASLTYLRHYGWPGNVRELENAIHRAFLMSDDDVVRLGDVSQSCGVSHAPDEDGQRTFRKAKAEAIARFEVDYLRRLLDASNGNLSLAARMAGEERSSFGKLVRRHGLTKDRSN